MPMSPEDRQKVIDAVLSIELHRFLDFKLLSCADSQASIAFTTSSRHMTPNKTLHGGITTSALDVTCLLAALTILDLHETAATIQSSTQNLSSATEGEEIIITAWIRKRTKRLIFTDSEAKSGSRIIARSQIVKSILGVKV